MTAESSMTAAVPPRKPMSARLEQLGRFLEIDPSNTTLLRDYAHEALRLGEIDAALAAVGKLAGRLESTPSEHAAVVAGLRMAGRNALAIAHLQEVADRWPGDPRLSIERARCLFAAHEFDEALDALPSDPSDPDVAAEAAALRVRLLHHLGQFDASLAAAQAFADRSGADARVQAAVLPVLVDLSRLEQAVDLAIELASRQEEGVPAPYEAAEPLALAALDAQRPADALRWVGVALQARHDDGRIRLVQGLAHLQGGDTSSALDALSLAVQLMPAHAGSHLALGWAQLVAGGRKPAREAFEAGVAASPGLAEAHGSLAVVDVMDGHVDAARAAIRRAQRLDAHCASALFAAALLKHPGEHDVARLAQRVLARARATGTSPRRH